MAVLSKAFLQSKIETTEEQQQNVMDARVIYIKKVGQALLERQGIRRQLQVLLDYASANIYSHVLCPKKYHHYVLPLASLTRKLTPSYTQHLASRGISRVYKGAKLANAHYDFCVDSGKDLNHHCILFLFTPALV